MALDPDLLALMPHTVAVRHRVSQDLYGEDSYSGAAIEYRCRIEPYRDRRLGNDQVESAPIYRIYVDSQSITVDDELTLPDGDIAPITRVTDEYDEKGVLVYQEVLA